MADKDDTTLDEIQSDPDDLRPDDEDDVQNQPDMDESLADEFVVPYNEEDK